MAKEVPSRAYYMINVLNTLRALGGEAHRKEIFAWMVDHDIARAEDLNTVQSDGGTRFRKHVDFSRKELLDAGLIADFDGFWHLTTTGADTYLDHATANGIVRLNQKLRPLRRARRKLTRREGCGAGFTTGPKPVSWNGSVNRDSLQPAITYAMRWGATDVWKVGHAISVERRLSEVNKHVPFEVLSTSWDLVLTQAWENCVLAYAMEQEVFALLAKNRSHGERLRCDEQRLLRAWREAHLAVTRSI